MIDIDCRAPEPGGVLVVGIIEPLDPELAHTHTDLAADGADLWNAAIVLAARAPTEGVVRLELDIQETRRLFGNDVRLVSVITSQATLLIYADKSVKGAGARTTRIVRSADLSESLQSFGQIYSTAPDADSLGFVSADGFCRVIIEDQHSIARMAIHLK